MATIAYLRVSTEGQDLDQQRLAILDYAQKHRVTIDEFVETQRSSQHAIQRAELMQMIEALQPGDRVIVSELSRFGRSLSQILQIIDRLIQKGLRLVAIKPEFWISYTTTGSPDSPRHSPSDGFLG